MKSIVSALAIVAAFSVPALADQCQEDIAQIDTALASQELGPEERTQLDDMRNQAVQLCGAGNTQEGLDVTREAKAILNIQ
jgi:hypothetical protein